MQRRILASDPALAAAITRPTQLPPELPESLAEALTRPGVPVIGLEGLAGIGKTTLAVQLGHQIAPSFPDGQLFTDLAVSPDPPGRAATRHRRHGPAAVLQRARGTMANPHHRPPPTPDLGRRPRRRPHPPPPPRSRRIGGGDHSTPAPVGLAICPLAETRRSRACPADLVHDRVQTMSVWLGVVS
jgi:hypothetical protein